MTKRIGLTLMACCVAVCSLFAQGANNIRINEVMTNNVHGIQDEFGKHGPWVELANSAFSSYNVRGMYITTDRSVLDQNMSVPERMKRMSIIPNGDPRTALSAKQFLVFHLNSNTSDGSLHLTAKVDATKPLWIALYDGNAEDLIDSITVPVLAADYSYARLTKEGDEVETWKVVNPEKVTPGIDNFTDAEETKIEKLKKDDPHGIGITVLCMGIVFACLALLFIFFYIFGLVADHFNNVKKVAAKTPIKPVVKPVMKVGKKIDETVHVAKNILQDGIETKGRDKEIYIAVISMALKQYLDDAHDVESGILTIKPKKSAWGAHSTFNNLQKK